MANNIPEFMRAAAEPFPDAIYGPGVRCSAYLNDGTYLPCVMLRKSAPVTQLALRRFDELRPRLLQSSARSSYEEVVRNFVAHGNRVNDYDVARVEESPFAIPLSLLRQIQGETQMSWTGFVLEMNDGANFSFGTSFLMEFFALPASYQFRDVAKVHNHSYVGVDGNVKSLREDPRGVLGDYDPKSLFRERPYFVCNVDK